MGKSSTSIVIKQKSPITVELRSQETEFRIRFSVKLSLSKIITRGSYLLDLKWYGGYPVSILK